MPEFAAKVYTAFLEAALDLGMNPADERSEGELSFFTGFFLYAMVRLLDIQHIIETDSSHGIRTLFMRKVCPECLIIVLAPEIPTTYKA